jgi:hypothetical protein
VPFPLRDRRDFRYGEGEQEACPPKEVDVVEQRKRSSNWGGRRRGAGAPKGNLNGFKHGRRSRQLAQAAAVLAANPGIRDTLIAIGNHAGKQQARADEVAARFLINAIARGVKIENPGQARAITDLLKALAK